MQHFKHKAYNVDYPPDNGKHKTNCPRCSKNKNGKSRNPRLLISHKSICKSSKCIIHSKNRPSAIAKANIKLKKERKLYKYFADKKHVKINLIDAPCSVDEFEEIGNNFEDIDKEIFAKIETVVENFDRSEINSDELIGYGLLKEIINRTIIWPMRKPEIFKGLRTAPKGILFFGPPGTGKSTLGKLIAYETNSTFFNISPSTLTSKWLGESEKLVRTMFIVAKARQPSVIFIDEIDSLLSQRLPDEDGSIRRMKNEFFICMDGGDVMGSEDRVLIIGATNRPHELDEAARRRFFKRFYIPLPDKLARKEILLKLLEHECHSLEEIDVNEIVKRTEGYSLADLKNLSHEAAMGSIKPLPRNAFDFLKSRDIRPISLDDFLGALQLIKPTVSKDEVRSYEIWDSKYGKPSESQENTKVYIQSNPYIL